MKDFESRERLVLRGLDRALSDKSEPACEGCRSEAFGPQLAPLGQDGGTILFEDVAAIEVTVLIEMIFDRGVVRGEFPQSHFVPEPRYRSFSSPERLM